MRSLPGCTVGEALHLWGNLPVIACRIVGVLMGWNFSNCARCSVFDVLPVLVKECFSGNFSIH